MIDFKRLPKDGEDFELLCRDVLQSMGAKIISHPSRGPDGKKDLIIEMEMTNDFGENSRTKYLVQCKHHAHSGKSVLEKELGDILPACKKHETDGYFLITTTIPSTTVSGNLENHIYIKTLCWDKSVLSEKIENLSNSSEILKKYNLKDSIDILSHLVKSVLKKSEKDKYFLSEKLEDPHYKIFEYKYLEFSENKEKEIIEAIICIDDTIDETKIEELKSKYQKYTFVGTEEVKTDIATSFDEFYEELLSLKDNFYQDKILEVLLTVPQNPTCILIFEKLFINSDYPLSKKVEDFIGYALSSLKGFDPFLIIEVTNVLVKKQIKLKNEELFSAISQIAQVKNDDIQRSFVLQRLINALSKLDTEKKFLPKMKKLFLSKITIQKKCDLLDYFKNLKIQEKKIDEELKKLKKDFSEKKLFAKNHGVFYNSEQIRLVENTVPYDIKRYIYEFYKK